MSILPWLIRQVAFGGEAVLSAAPEGRGDCVFGSAPPEAIVPHNGAWRVPFGPASFFKTSYARHAVGNGAANYVMTRHGQSHALVYRPVLTTPDQYVETLAGEPFGSGQAAALFRDDGRFGSYGEVELYGHRAATGRHRLVADCQFLAGPTETVNDALAA